MTNPRLAPYIPYALTTHAKFYPRGPFPSIILAQGILESDWFTETSGKNNFFGIKANPAQIAVGHYKIRWTHETLNGQYVKKQQPFACYDTPGDCFDAHAHLLTTPWYQRCVDAPNPQAYAHALWLCHYATGIPGHPYDQALIQIMDQNDLYQYDQKGT